MAATIPAEAPPTLRSAPADCQRGASALLYLQDDAVRARKIVQPREFGQIAAQITLLQLLELIGQHPTFMSGRVERSDFKIGVPQNRRSQTGHVLILRVCSRSSRLVADFLCFRGKS